MLSLFSALACRTGFDPKPEIFYHSHEAAVIVIIKQFDRLICDRLRDSVISLGYAACHSCDRVGIPADRYRFEYNTELLILEPDFFSQAGHLGGLWDMVCAIMVPVKHRGRS